MSERKVLNKYYPPDFDPSKIPRMKLPKNRQYTVRLMAPFNMRCKTCGEYIYKGKKFNARKEDVEGDDYLGIRIYRFYIKCTRCLAEISFRTDPRNTDYEIEAGATRNFMALKLAEEQAIREEEEEKEEDATNPMKLLEKRTAASRRELEILESLEELRDLNRRQQAVDYESLIGRYEKDRVVKEEEQEELDEKFIKSVFGQKKKIVGEEEVVEDEVDEDSGPPPKLSRFSDKECTVTATQVSVSKPTTSFVKGKTVSVGVPKRGGKTGLLGLVKLKPPNSATVSEDKSPSVSNSAPALKEKIVTEEPKGQTSALGLLGAYSDSDTSD